MEFIPCLLLIVAFNDRLNMTLEFEPLLRLTVINRDVKASVELVDELLPAAKS